jgi:hypothetical protein
MLNLNYSYNQDIESAYIITIKNHGVSEKLSLRCQKSCKKLGMPYKVWEAYDGTSGKIKEPEHLKNSVHMSWFKQLDQKLSVTEVCCALSHISLYCHCIEIDRPIVILEHDAIMLKKINEHPCYNTILYLGSVEQYKQGCPILHTPIHLGKSKNLHCMCRTHAYSIDPPIAKNIISHILKLGIHESADVMLRADIFPIVQLGLYAYDESDAANTTIKTII